MCDLFVPNSTTQHELLKRLIPKPFHFVLLSLKLRHARVSPALAQLVILGLEHVQLLGKANDDHEEQEHHESRGPDGDAHYLELCDDRFAAGTLVPHVVLDVAPARQRKGNISLFHKIDNSLILPETDFNAMVRS